MPTFSLQSSLRALEAQSDAVELWITHHSLRECPSFALIHARCNVDDTPSVSICTYIIVFPALLGHSFHTLSVSVVLWSYTLAFVGQKRESRECREDEFYLDRHDPICCNYYTRCGMDIRKTPERPEDHGEEGGDAEPPPAFGLDLRRCGYCTVRIARRGTIKMDGRRAGGTSAGGA